MKTALTHLWNWIYIHIPPIGLAHAWLQIRTNPQLVTQRWAWPAPPVTTKGAK